MCLSDHRVESSLVVAGSRRLLRLQEVRIVAPVTLDELELLPDVTLVAEEEQTDAAFGLFVRV